MKSRRSKATDISAKTKAIVWERDNHRCVICGSSQAMPNAHYIPRSKGGLGIAQNVVTLCLQCHHAYDQTTQRKEIGEFIGEYLEAVYEGFDDHERYYKKGK